MRFGDATQSWVSFCVGENWNLSYKEIDNFGFLPPISFLFILRNVYFVQIPQNISRTALHDFTKIRLKHSNAFFSLARQLFVDAFRMLK